MLSNPRLCFVSKWRLSFAAFKPPTIFALARVLGVASPFRFKHVVQLSATIGQPNSAYGCLHQEPRLQHNILVPANLLALEPHEDPSFHRSVDHPLIISCDRFRPERVRSLVHCNASSQRDTHHCTGVLIFEVPILSADKTGSIVCS